MLRSETVSATGSGPGRPRENSGLRVQGGRQGGARNTQVPAHKHTGSGTHSHPNPHEAAWSAGPGRLQHEHKALHEAGVPQRW